MNKLFLDDVRHPWNTDWWVVRNYDQFVRHVEKHGMPDVIAFDHDLGGMHSNFDGEGKTGYDCAEWLVQYAVMNKLTLPNIVIVHSYNSAGAKRIASLFKGIGAVLVFPYPCTPLKEFLSKL